MIHQRWTTEFGSMLISLFSIFLIIFINQIQHIALVDSTKKIACKDEQNRDVDWWVEYGVRSIDWKINL